MLSLTDNILINNNPEFPKKNADASIKAFLESKQTSSVIEDYENLYIHGFIRYYIGARDASKLQLFIYNYYVIIQGSEHIDDDAIIWVANLLYTKLDTEEWRSLMRGIIFNYNVHVASYIVSKYKIYDIDMHTLISGICSRKKDRVNTLEMLYNHTVTYEIDVDWEDMAKLAIHKNPVIAQYIISRHYTPNVFAKLQSELDT